MTKLIISKNPGVNKKDQSDSFLSRANTSGVFKKVIPYTPKINMSREKQRLEKENEGELRYCLNWACEKEYKESENSKKKTCRCHPGVWDFGHTGASVAKSMSGSSENLLWTAHWTCCRQKWDVPGCYTTYHKGPLLKSLPERKYKWPDEELQKSFHKVVSGLWKDNIIKGYEYDRDKLSYLFDAFAKYNGSNGVFLNNYSLRERDLVFGLKQIYLISWHDSRILNVDYGMIQMNNCHLNVF